MRRPSRCRTSLQRTPNRTHSLLALARASVKLGDVETANEAYATLKRFLKDADANVPFLNEVRSYEASTDAGGN